MLHPAIQEASAARRDLWNLTRSVDAEYEKMHARLNWERIHNRVDVPEPPMYDYGFITRNVAAGVEALNRFEKASRRLQPEQLFRRDYRALRVYVRAVNAIAAEDNPQYTHALLCVYGTLTVVVEAAMNGEATRREKDGPARRSEAARKANETRKARAAVEVAS